MLLNWFRPAPADPVEGMGHDVARAYWPAVLDGIKRTVRRGEPRTAA